METAEAPALRGHYSQAVIANRFVFVSGQLPIKSGGPHETPAGIEAHRPGRVVAVSPQLHLFSGDSGDWACRQVTRPFPTVAESMSQYLIRRIEEAPIISLHTRMQLAALDGASVSPGRAAMRHPK